jgi:serine/threonine protein kinase/LysM repeat protein
MDSLIGQSLGRYHILEQLGEGGMATVYKAFDTRLEANVAVKVIRTENLPQSGVGRALKRFEREAKALAQINHPNIVKVIDYGEYKSKPFLVMPYLEGGTLKALMQARGALPWQEAVRLLLPISKALAYAHQHGMIHRDVKPSNVLITDSGEPMLSDFGVTKIIEDEATVDLTGTNAAIGTPEYMAPEQATSKSIDHRADIYSLGIVFYEMVTGRKPYVADTPLAVLIKHVRDPLPRPSQFLPSLPVEVERVLLKALAKKPEDRYQAMGEFAAALEGCLAETTTEQMKGKSVQASVKSDRNGILPAQNDKAIVQKETPPIVTQLHKASTSERPSKPKHETVVRGKSGKKVILLSGIVVMAAIICLGVVLITTIRWSTSKFGMRTELSGTSTLNEICPTSSLKEPILQSPDDFSIVTSLSPDFAWTYPDIDCHPQGYRFELKYEMDNVPETAFYETNDSRTSLKSLVKLAPGIEYWWQIAAMNGTTYGPFSPSRRFFTGPFCARSALVAPTLIGPADGMTVATKMPVFHWANGNAGCIPEGYGIHLSSEPHFVDTSLNGGTGNPDQYWRPGNELADCTTYYWNVFAGIGTSFSSVSPTHSFRTNFGGTACATTVPQPVPTATPGTQSIPTPTISIPATYMLHEGETGYCLARRFNIDFNELMSLNGLTIDSLIYPGDILKIPHNGKTFEGDRSLHPHTPNMVYTVSTPYDTIYKIACYFGDVDPNAIIAANNLQPPYTLRIGSTIIIP